MNFSIHTRRCTEDNFFAFSYLSGYSQHEHSRKQRRTATRYIKTYFFDGNCFLPAVNAWRGLYLGIFALLLGVEFPDVSACHFDGLFQFYRNSFYPFSYFFFRNFRYFHVHFVEFQGEISQRGIALLPDFVERHFNLVIERCYIQRWPFE